MKQGLVRSLAVLMFAAIPLVSAHPTEGLQEISGTVYSVASQPFSQEKGLSRGAPRVVIGMASWYSRSSPGIKRRTASGEIFNDKRMTCASWKFPLKTCLKIINLANGKSVTCVVNDRGPAKRLGREIDLTRAAFARIASPRKGLVRVAIVPILD